MYLRILKRIVRLFKLHFSKHIRYCTREAIWVFFRYWLSKYGYKNLDPDLVKNIQIIHKTRKMTDELPHRSIENQIYMISGHQDRQSDFIRIDFGNRRV